MIYEIGSVEKAVGAELESNSGKEHTNNTNIYGKDEVALDLCGW